MTILQGARSGFGSSAAHRKPRPGPRRKRGTTLLELVLYLGVAASIIAFSLGLVREQQVQGERSALAGELRQVITASQTYFQANYEAIRDELLADTAVGAPLIRAYSLADVINEGFLPRIFATGTAPKSFAEPFNFAIVVRAVLRSNNAVGAVPATLTRTDAILAPNVVGQPRRFRNALVDNRFVQIAPGAAVLPANDEIDLEALLVTISDNVCSIVPFQSGNRIVAETELTVAGYTTGLPAAGPNGGTIRDGCPLDIARDPTWIFTPTETATGPYQLWALPLAPYAEVTLLAANNNDNNEFTGTFVNTRAVQAGRFAALLSVQGRPPLSEADRVAAAGDSAFRCVDVPQNTTEEVACQQDGRTYSNITFQSWDSDNNGVDDQFPGLQQVNTIGMTLRPSTVAAAPQIQNVLSMSCANGGMTSEVGRFKVDCPETEISGLVITRNSELNTTTVVTNNVEADKLTLNNEDVAPKLANRSTLTANGGGSSFRVDRPACPTGTSPDISVSPVSYSVDGIVRSVEVTTDRNGDVWDVDLIVSFVRDIDGSTVEVENPAGSEILVLTGCKA